ncbi:MAG: PEP-CTERM sorting domain-containing protein [Gemmatimonadota bacterium]
MNGLNKTLGVLAACALFGTATASASGFQGGRDCVGSSFGTCSAAALNVADGRLAMGHLNITWHDWEMVGNRRNFEIIPMAGDPGQGNPGPSTVTGCPVPSGNPHDCPPFTVTPEPMTMTLLATGLLSMSGMGFIRRRKNRLAE